MNGPQNKDIEAWEGEGGAARDPKQSMIAVLEDKRVEALSKAQGRLFYSRMARDQRSGPAVDTSRCPLPGDQEQQAR
jgi:hypothetical protein